MKRWIDTKTLFVVSIFCLFFYEYLETFSRKFSCVYFHVMQSIDANSLCTFLSHTVQHLLKMIFFDSLSYNIKQQILDQKPLIHSSALTPPPRSSFSV